MAIEIKETEFENYGKCVHISNGMIEVSVTIDIGPRIVQFGFIGGKNMLYNDLERRYSITDENYQEIFGQGRKFHSYGGHRLSICPANMPETLYPDNEPVVYGILPEGVTFSPARQKHNDIQLGFEVMMNEDATDIMVIHSAKNHSKNVQTLSLCASSMLIPDGLEIVPQNHGGDEYRPNRIFALWPYMQITDPRAFWGEKFITLQHDSKYDHPFKLGTDNLLGWAAYVSGNTTLVKRYVHNTQAAYPDGGASFATYLNKDYLEMTTMSPLYQIEPGDTVRHVENLALFKANNAPNPKDDEQLGKFIENLK